MRIFSNISSKNYARTQRVSSKIGTTENLGDFLQDWFTQGTGGPVDVIGSSFGVLENAEEGVVQVYDEFDIEPPVYDSDPVFIPVQSFVHGANENEIYWFHPDHLGSTSYITNLLGEVSQHMEYFAFGEMFVEEHRSSNNSPYKFNGKELDEETGWYYYGARYYDPRISLWLSVDPLANVDYLMNDEAYINGEHNGGVFNSFNHNSYAYCYQNPVILKDPDGKQTIAELTSGYKVDMNNAPNSSAVNAKGFKRNGPWFWRQVRDTNPNMFSASNKSLIAKGLAPIVDETWIKYNPSSANYMGDKLVHHHIDQGRFAVGMSEKAHVGMTKQLHNRSSNWFKKNGVLGKSLNSLTLLTTSLDIYKITTNHPDAMFSTFNPNAPLNTLQGITPEDPIMWLFFGNDYYEIKSRNEEGTKLQLKFYNDYKKENGVYRGEGNGTDYEANKNKDGTWQLSNKKEVL